MSEIERLKAEIERLKAEIKQMKEDQAANYRKFVRDSDRRQSFITLRIVQLGFMEGVFIDNVEKEKIYIDPNDGKKIPQYHPDRKIMVNKRKAISMRLSNKYEKMNGLRPPIDSATRSNFYTEEEMTQWGDQIIKDFMWKNPIDEWGVEWDRGMMSKRQPLDREALARLCGRETR